MEVVPQQDYYVAPEQYVDPKLNIFNEPVYTAPAYSPLPPQMEVVPQQDYYVAPEQYVNPKLNIFNEPVYTAPAYSPLPPQMEVVPQLNVFNEPVYTAPAYSPLPPQMEVVPQPNYTSPVPFQQGSVNLPVVQPTTVTTVKTIDWKTSILILLGIFFVTKLFDKKKQ
jgi:hypothetical protein